MKSTSLVSAHVLVLSIAALSAAAQTPTAPAPRPPAAHAPTTGTHPASSRGACVKLPVISPKVPAVPGGLSCARALYTISSVPTVKLAYVSPLEGSALSETLGLPEASSFTLAYIDTKVGTGALAAPHKWYTVNYTGYLTDGTKFDSSYDRGEPFSIPYGQHSVIIGWDTGFDGMHIGGKRRLFIPYQLAYQAKGSPPTIPPKADLIFDLELVSQSDTKPEPKTPPTPPPAAAPAPATSPAPAGAPTPTNPAQPSTPPPASAPETTPKPSTPPMQ